MTSLKGTPPLLGGNLNASQTEDTVNSSLSSLQDSPRGDQGLIKRRPTTIYPSRPPSCLERFVNRMPTFAYSYGQELYFEEGRAHKVRYRMKGLASLLFLFAVVTGFTVIVLSEFSQIGVEVVGRHLMGTNGFNSSIELQLKDYHRLALRYYTKKVPSGESLCKVASITFEFGTTSESCKGSCYYFIEEDVENVLFSLSSLEEINESTGRKHHQVHVEGECTQDQLNKPVQPMLPFIRIVLGFSPKLDGDYYNLDKLGLLSPNSDYSVLVLKYDSSITKTIPYDLDYSTSQINYRNRLSSEALASSSFLGLIQSTFERLNPFRNTTLIQNSLDYKQDFKVHTIGAEPLFLVLRFTYPPTSVEVVDFVTLSDFLIKIGSYFSLLKAFVSLVIGYFIFREMNKFMAARLLRPEVTGQQLPPEEFARRQAQKEAVFRHRVSQEGIYYLHDDVLYLERRQEEQSQLQEQTIRELTQELQMERRLREALELKVDRLLEGQHSLD